MKKKSKLPKLPDYIKTAQQRVDEIDAGEYPIQYERACIALHAAFARASEDLASKIQTQTQP
jgi:hypothetical protein